MYRLISSMVLSIFLFGGIAAASEPNPLVKGYLSSSEKLSGRKYYKQRGYITNINIDQDRFTQARWLASGDSVIYKIRLKKNNKIYRNLFIRSTAISNKAGFGAYLSKYSNFSGDNILNNKWKCGNYNEPANITRCNLGDIHKLLKTDFLYLKIVNHSIYTSKYGQEIYRSNPRSIPKPKPSITITPTRNIIRTSTNPTIRWSAKNATTCSASYRVYGRGGSTKYYSRVSGSIRVYGKGKRYFRITCKGSGGTTYKSKFLRIY